MSLGFNSERFVQETIDGETIVMDTVSGRLLLLRETAPLLLSRMNACLPPDALLEEILNRYGVEAKTQANDFFVRLAELGVLATQDLAKTGLAPRDGAVEWPTVFVPPVVEVYDDIADIITMDPIHDVDVDSGWPRAAAKSHE